MATIAAPIADRLSFAWDGPTRCVITEHLKTKDKPTAYVTEDVARGDAAGEVALFAKADDYTGPRDSEVYEAFLSADGQRWACSCSGSQTRKHGIRCRHVLALAARRDQLTHTENCHG